MDPLSIRTEEAIVDFHDGLAQSPTFGATTARHMRQRLVSRFERIAQGRGYGHRRADVMTTEPILFVVVVQPLVVAYNSQTRMVLRILDRRRDFTRLFGE